MPSMTMDSKGTKVKQPIGDVIFDIIIFIILMFVNVVMIYPLLYVLATSISDPGEVIRGNVYIIPKGFDLGAVNEMIKHPQFPTSYMNTIMYTTCGTVLTLLVTPMAAYPLATDKFKARGFISILYVITMFFGGGMIPTYLNMRMLHLLDTRLVMIIPGVISAWNLIIMRSFFRGIPGSLHESAYIDGANDWTVLWKIVMPLSKPVLATIGLFTAVGYWNDFFSALLYLNDANLYSLQMVLRSILVDATMASSGGADGQKDVDQNKAMSTQSLKSASIVLTMIPIMCVYPFVQKYFAKGVMIGSVKG